MMLSSTALACQVFAAMAAAKQRACRVAVIGGGAAGVVAAHELEKEGHHVVVYEQSSALGGTWDYTDEVEKEDLLGLNPHRKRIHTSLYRSLRTNLPREIMGFLDFPFLPKKGRDERRFPGHREVLLYLQDFAQHFSLHRFVRFNTRVQRLALHPCSTQLPSDAEIHGSLQWSVISQSVETSELADIQGLQEDIYDAVVICNGHFSEPRTATFPGIEKWPGKQLHSHNYRVPDPFKEQVVVVVGNASSGNDIAIEIAKVAKEVHWSGRTWKTQIDVSQPIAPSCNIWLHYEIKSAYEDGTINFQDGSSVHADVIVHCTGYWYSFPFLDAQSIVTVDDNCVGPLYQHVFPPSLAPSISFIGLPWKVIPFPMFQLQAKWIAQNLSGRIHLPSKEQMFKEIEEFYSRLTSKGFPKHHTHNLSGFQVEYHDWLARQCQCTSLEPWKMQIYNATAMARMADPENYRDMV